ncbi:rho GTPase-activating protein 32 [Conger conger]|uniref:rho GTPase-activating protein 32 n=1 Tax=Conger conger TaxID=82655 RepID=UPI002A5A2C8E|nr:rho GTPase-activating protein 32 [Conger conger]
MEPGGGPADASALEDSAALGLLLLRAAGSHDALDRSLRSCPFLEEEEEEDEDDVPELPLSIHPRERPDWEETISAMARSAEIPELTSDPPLRSCGSTASMKVKNVKKLSFTKGHFPKLAECAHFHYENVDFGTIQLALAEEQNEVTRNGQELKELVYLIQICCQGRSWIVRRSYEDFRVLDKHLHLCIYDRRFSQLAELPRFHTLKEQPETVSQMLMAYLSRFSAIADNKINCGPVLTWMEIDNKGNHLLVHEESSINVPAIAAAHVIKRYLAQASDELSFEVGDIVSVIDMPPKEDTTWWRGKHGFQVGFFPSECVELINDKIPQSVTNCVPKPASPIPGLRPPTWSFFPPYLEMDSIKQDNAWASSPLNCYGLSSVSKKHGKLITFLRTFMKSRPSKQKLKQRGILRERVFGCDLGEHLLNSGHDVPQVLKSCTEFIEKHGVVDGIYRLSGIASNIQKLRHEFDSEQIPDLTKDLYIQDIHCVGSLCKLYFRELPNPLLTYQLYEKFSEAVSAATDEERLIKIHDVIQQLPPPHYRTLEFLMRHLSRLATFSYVTNMHSKNLAIVWAPNLLRSKQIESACFSGTAAFMEVRIQSVVVEFILNHVDVLFSPKLSLLIREGTGHGSLSRPKSLLVSSPSTKLLTLEEAQARTQAQINSPVTADSKYIEVGEGPAALQGKFHTIIEFPTERKRPPGKTKKSPVGSWRSFFNLGKSSSVSKRKLQRNPSEPSQLKNMALAGGRGGDSGTLRSAKSEESLSSLHNVEGEVKMLRPRRPRSSSDALSASFPGELDGRQHCGSYDTLPRGESEGDEGQLRVPALISPPCSAEDVDLLSPPDLGVASLDFDPMSFQCSLPAFEPAPPSPASREGASPPRSAPEPASPAPASPDGLALSPKPSPTTQCPSPSSIAVGTPRGPSPDALRGPSDSPPPRSPPAEPSVGATAGLVSERDCSAPPGSAPPAPASPPPYTVSAQPLSGATGPGPQGQPLCAAAMETSVPPLCDITEAATNHPGPVAADPRQEGPPVSAASLLPPPPPPKNAARLLALALAESAQQATVLCEGRASGPPPPDPPPSPPERPPQPHTSPATPAPLPPAAAPVDVQRATGEQEPEGTESPQPPATPGARASPRPPAPPGAHANACLGGEGGQHGASAAPSPPARIWPPRGSPASDPVPVSAPSPVSAAREHGTPSQQEVNEESRRTMQTSENLPSPTPPKPIESPVAVETPRPAATPVPATPPRTAEKPTPPRAPPRAYIAPPPAPPVRSSDSRLAAAAFSGTEAANASNFHAILAEACVPSSVEEVLPHPPPPPRKSSAHQPPYLYYPKAEAVTDPPPSEAYYHPRATPTGPPYHYRPESVPPHLPWASKSDPQILYHACGDARYATLGPKSFHQSFKSQGPHRGEYPPGRHPRQGYGAQDGALGYPAIRRVQSLHAAPTGVRAAPGSRAELPLEDQSVYYQRPVYHYKAVYRPAPPSQAEYHVTQLQPYFENGRVQYRYSPYSGSHPPDGPCYEADRYATLRLRHRPPPFPPHPVRAGGKASGCHYLPRHLLPLGKEHSFVSRDMPPSGGPKGPVYLAWDPEDLDRVYMHSLRRDNRARQKVKVHVASPYDNVVLLDPGAPETRHLRSKSDPGKAVLVAVEGRDGLYAVTQHHPRHPPPDTEVLVYAEQDRRYHGNGLADRPAAAASHSKHGGSRSSQHAPHQDPGHPNPKVAPTDHKPGGRHRQEPPEPRGPPPRYELPDPDRHAGRAKIPPGYPDQDPQVLPVKVPAAPKPDRSQSVRERQHYHPQPAEGAERGNHSSNPHGKLPTSHYDNLDDYRPAPKQPAPHGRGGGAGHCPSSGFTPSHGNRTFSTALGQGAFLPAELPLQRPDTEIRAE